MNRSGPAVNIPFNMGGYVLVLRLDEGREISVGKLDSLYFNMGYYAYAGSAMGGLKQRIARHLRQDKKLHWHIDYLLKHALVDEVIVCESMKRIECDIAGVIKEEFELIGRFGSSDCKCRSHLFYSPVGMTEKIIDLLKSAGMNPCLVNYRRMVSEK